MHRFFFVLLSTCALLVLYFYFPLPEHYWLLWLGFLLSQLNLGETLKQRVVYLAATTFFSIVCICAASYAVANPSLLAALLFVVTASCVWLSGKFVQQTTMFFTINLFVILGACFATGGASIKNCIAFLGAGSLVVIFLQVLFFSREKKNEGRALERLAFRSLQQFNQDFFACLLEADYLENRYIYEKRLHDQKVKFMQIVLSVSDQQIASKLNELFASMLDYAQLRARVSDFTIFSVCVKELTAIADDINKLLSLLLSATGKREALETENLANQILKFEDHYQHVLKIAAKEPLPFVLFIAGLRNFSAEVAKFD
jgi:hypothetical protein